MWSLVSSFFQHNVLKFIHIVAWIRTLFLSIAESYSIEWIWHIVFLHSSIDVLFLLFYYCEQRSSEHSCTRYCVNMLSVLFGVYLGIEFLGHRIAQCLAFDNLPAVFPSGCTSNGWWFQFLHILGSTCCYLNFWWYPSWRVWSVVLLRLSLTNDVEHRFMFIGRL